MRHLLSHICDIEKILYYWRCDMAFYCKYCGRDYKDVKYMLTCSCPKSPTKKHELL